MRKRNLEKLAKINPSCADIQKALERFDWEAHFRRVDEAIAPQIEAYRIAAARSYAQARHTVFV